MEFGNQLRESVLGASGRAEVCRAVLGVYEELQREIDQRRPVCVMSGKCCRFEEYGHRLYVTTAELAAFAAALERSGEKVERREDPHPGPPLFERVLDPEAADRRQPQSRRPEYQGRGKEEQRGKWNRGGCVFQVGRMCGVHGIRPMGCRVFFCDPGATEWQREAYERMHGRLKKLHEDMSIPYAYVEWGEACRVMGWEGNAEWRGSCEL